MIEARGLLAARILAATVLVATPAAEVEADEHDAFPPQILHLADVTGDGVADVVALQRVLASPFDALVRVVDGRSGVVVWDRVVPKFAVAQPVSLGQGRGVVVAAQVEGSPADLNDNALRLVAVGGDGRVTWERTFEGHDVVPNFVPSYVSTSLRGSLARRGAPDLLLVQSNARAEAGARRVTTTTALLVDASTGETVAQHRRPEMFEADVALVALPDVGGDGVADFGVLERPSSSNEPEPGTLRAVDALSGSDHWTAGIRSDRGTDVVTTVGGRPPLPALSLTSHASPAGGVQLLDQRSGALLVNRPYGESTVLVDGTGGRGRMRTYYFNDGGRNGYHVELLDLRGRPLRRTFVGVGDGSTYATLHQQMAEAGDLDGDGWNELLVHVAFGTAGEPTAFDDRIVDGRTLGPTAVPRTLQPLTLHEPSGVAVDGRGADLYLAGDHLARVVDGRTRRALLDVRSEDDFLGILLGVTDRGAACADVLVTTYTSRRFELTRLGPRGEVRWSTDPGAVTAKDVSGDAGCAQRGTGAAPLAAQRPAPARRPVIPATGGLPGAGAAVALVTAAVVLRRRCRAA